MEGNAASMLVAISSPFTPASKRTDTNSASEEEEELPAGCTSTAACSLGALTMNFFPFFAGSAGPGCEGTSLDMTAGGGEDDGSQGAWDGVYRAPSVAPCECRYESRGGWQCSVCVLGVRPSAIAQQRQQQQQQQQPSSHREPSTTPQAQQSTEQERKAERGEERTQHRQASISLTSPAVSARSSVVCLAQPQPLSTALCLASAASNLSFARRLYHSSP